MLLRMVKAGLLTGFLTAVFYTFIYSVLILPIIQKAEIIEKGHISSELRIKTSDQSDKKRNLVTPSLEKNDEKDSSTQILLNDHYQDTLLTKRFFFTFLANLILAVGFSFLIIAAFILSNVKVGVGNGVLWGLGGYLVFTIAPSLGISPELPGTFFGDLGYKQFSWISISILTALGLWFLVFRKSYILKMIGILIILIPQIALPDVTNHSTSASIPESLYGEFLINTLVSLFLFWVFLGASSGAILRKLSNA
ncbi:MAG: hypothetical protein CL568_07045 [Alphaproteobacteria bacterium]|jgi:cobalt transporter subunit CbtA|nr:hypothetical protein [Alphaproteobacteria bacterium]PPR12461.1 MAG: hypothetical protein CFH42_02214 [Alphaproteobacteria bacterium MarineAlpha12_Bin1]|tara:strand:- start:5488 stop:6243 length:756 start_codon:yes stop_codon:yes gene_type:complete